MQYRDVEKRFGYRWKTCTFNLHLLQQIPTINGCCSSKLHLVLHSLYGQPTQNNYCFASANQWYKRSVEKFISVRHIVPEAQWNTKFPLCDFCCTPCGKKRSAIVVWQLPVQVHFENTVHLENFLKHDWMSR